VNITTTEGDDNIDHNPGTPIAVHTAGNVGTNEDTPLALGGISVEEGAPSVLTVDLTVGHGMLAVGAASDFTVTGSGTAHLVVTGTPAQVNALLQHLVYTNTPDWNGSDSLAISATDGVKSASANIGITVNAIRDATDDAISTARDTSLTFNVLTGTQGATADLFLNPDRAVTSITQPTNGAVTYAPDGTMTFTPVAGFVGNTAFTYTVTSGGKIETATVTVTVTSMIGKPGPFDPTPFPPKPSAVIDPRLENRAERR
jgi:large repetitive protein